MTAYTWYDVIWEVEGFSRVSTISAPTIEEAVGVVRHYLMVLGIDDARIHTNVDDEPIPDERPYNVWDDEPQEDDSLPDWAAYYPNESDYWKENRP